MCVKSFHYVWKLHKVWMELCVDSLHRCVDEAVCRVVTQGVWMDPFVK